MKCYQYIVLIISLISIHLNKLVNLEVLPLNINEPEASNSNIFDSYYNLTNLESYPDICEDYSDEDCAKEWYESVNKVILRNENRMSNVNYRYSTDINERNLKLVEKFHIRYYQLDKLLQLKDQQFKWKNFKSFELHRIFKMLFLTKASKNESISKRIVEIQNDISRIYNNGKPCAPECLRPGEMGIVDLFSNERDYDKLSRFWVSWTNVTGSKIKDLFVEKMNLENIGSRENGYKDAASFNLMTEFEENNFDKTVFKLYENILPLYKELHAYVRYCLAKYYPGRFDKNGSIPAHLFGNVWAQQWANIFPIIKQCNEISSNNNYHLEANENLEKYSVKELFKIAEEFYASIGMYKMTDEFWERSVLSQPKNKMVDCHGSAYDFSNKRDFRIVMCTRKNLEDFSSIHHEMGHIQHFMAYRYLPFVFRDSANTAFHEAVGDTIALSVNTPEHLYKIGLISSIPKTEDFDIEYLMITALDKVVILPFALIMDSYIWGVYNGSVPVSKLNEHWWNLREKFQGIKPPVERTENDFDPGAKYHIAFGVSYIRYFISFICQFQFYESMCNISGYKGPLHRCDFYESKEAGRKLLDMLKEGKRQHWKKTIKILTGDEEIKSDSLLKFFDPLYKWLKTRNEKLNVHVGW